MVDLILVVAASGLAGFVDAIVGGGGLVLIPAMFAAYPTASAATLLGTNKAGAVWGTAWASCQYAQRVPLQWRLLLPALCTAVVGAFVGAWAVSNLPALGLRKVLPWLLGAVLVYTLWQKQMGREHAPRWAPRIERMLAAAIGAGVGFYDGFFGPGTGSFFVFLFVRLLGYDFLNASAAAKLLNSATNAAALALFAWRGHVWWHVALGLAVANVAGSWLGTRLALRHGAGFVRTVFIVVVAALILKTAVDGARL